MGRSSSYAHKQKDRGELVDTSQIFCTNNEAVEAEDGAPQTSSDVELKTFDEVGWLMSL